MLVFGLHSLSGAHPTRAERSFSHLRRPRRRPSPPYVQVQRKHQSAPTRAPAVKRSRSLRRLFSCSFSFDAPFLRSEAAARSLRPFDVCTNAPATLPLSSCDGTNASISGQTRKRPSHNTADLLLSSGLRRIQIHKAQGGRFGSGHERQNST